MSPPSSRFCLPPDFTLVSCLAYSSTPKIEAIYSSETSVDFQRTKRRYIPEDIALHNHRRENLKSYTDLVSQHILWRSSIGGCWDRGSLWCDILQSCKQILTFRRNTLPLWSPLNPEDRQNMFNRNVGILRQNYKMSQPKRPQTTVLVSII
jgi:hypothetical protein